MTTDATLDDELRATIQRRGPHAGAALALEYLYSRTYGRMLKCVRDVSVAQDLTQTWALRLTKAIGTTWDHSRPIGPYSTTIATNVLVVYFRERSNSREVLTADLPDEAAGGAGVLGAQHRTSLPSKVHKERERAVARAVLGPALRELGEAGRMFFQSAIDEMTQREIAERNNTTRQRVRTMHDGAIFQLAATWRKRGRESDEVGDD